MTSPPTWLDLHLLHLAPPGTTWHHHWSYHPVPGTDPLYEAGNPGLHSDHSLLSLCLLDLQLIFSCTENSALHCTMPPKRRAAAAGLDQDSGGLQPPSKAKKPTAATNAEAIAMLASQMTGVDSRLVTIANLLNNFMAGMPQGNAPLTQQPPTQQTQGSLSFAPYTQTSAIGNWTHTPTLSDLEGENTITRRVAEALQAVATPFTANPGKHAIFPHDTVTRGLKKQKCNLGELTLPELWGIIQLIKAKDPDDVDVFYMNLHLEKVAKEAKTYDRECVRAWSEEIFLRISKSKLEWSDSYIIDRLQIQFSPDRTQSAKEAVKGNVTDKCRRP